MGRFDRTGENNTLFSYNANWEAPGRWSVEVITNKSRLILRPLEKLQIQKIGNLDPEFVQINDVLDVDYKPGLYEQTKSFINGNNLNLCDIDEHRKNFKY